MNLLIFIILIILFLFERVWQILQVWQMQAFLLLICRMLDCPTWARWHGLILCGLLRMWTAGTCFMVPVHTKRNSETCTTHLFLHALLNLRTETWPQKSANLARWAAVRLTQFSRRILGLLVRAFFSPVSWATVPQVKPLPHRHPSHTIPPKKESICNKFLISTVLCTSHTNKSYASGIPALST